METKVSLSVDGMTHDVLVDTRTTLLDGLRDRLGNFSPKKGCDHGQCGSCTVLVDGRRVVSCLSFAVSYEGTEIITADGLADGDGLHPMQQAFMDQDGFQCGFCTPGQICSAVGMLEEADRGFPSSVTDSPDPGGQADEPDAAELPATELSDAELSATELSDAELSDDELSDDEIRERMSGNLCRCAAYPNILAAIRQAADR